jgi:heme/copper-type cytochrome/quinol oxidase subunit 2
MCGDWMFDFAWILAIMTAFIHVDARQHGLSYWWILPTYPFMPTIGVLAYFMVRTRKRQQQKTP